MTKTGFDSRKHERRQARRGQLAEILEGQKDDAGQNYEAG
jgi:hypothetical protein